MSEFSEGSTAQIEIDYEALAPNHPMIVHLSAGALAGLAEHVVMLPIDSYKTRVQSLCPCVEAKCPTPIHGLASVMRQEGWLKPLRGVGAVAAGTMPAHALYFTAYEKLKLALTGNTYGYSNVLSYGLAGACATLVHDFIMNPAEVVKQRMQMKYSPYGGSLECARCIYRTEGISAFYRSYTIQLASNVPYQAIHFMTYEFLQQLLNPEHKYDPKTHLFAGGMAGGLAAAITVPFDCIKTVLNTQQSPEIDKRRILLKPAYSYSGIVDAVRSIYVSRGVGGFTRGCQARILYQMPGTALSWSVYEFFKFAFSEK